MPMWERVRLCKALATQMPQGRRFYVDTRGNVQFPERLQLIERLLDHGRIVNVPVQHEGDELGHALREEQLGTLMAERVLRRVLLRGRAAVAGYYVVQPKDDGKGFSKASFETTTELFAELWSLVLCSTLLTKASEGLLRWDQRVRVGL